jgi:integrase
MEPVPELYRRHLISCGHRDRSRTKCHCPIWCDFRIQGKRIRHSMKTSDWDRACRLIERMRGAAEEGKGSASATSIAAAIRDYFEDCQARELKPSTLMSYRRTLAHFENFCERLHYPTLASLTLEAFTQFHASRKSKDGARAARVSTLRKETECLRAFCAFACDRKWMNENLAEKLRPGKEPQPVTLPFEGDEIDRLFRAAETFGGHPSERVKWARKRIHAFMGLLIYSGLRISDAAQLARAQINRNSGHLLLREQMKTGTPHLMTKGTCSRGQKSRMLTCT